MDLASFLRAMRRQIVIVISCALIGLSCGAVYGLLTPPRYAASTQMMVSVQTSATATPVELAQASNYALQVAESYRSLLSSSLVLQPVIDDLGLEITAAELSGQLTTSIAPRSVIITATVEDGNPGQAARIANAISDSFTSAISDEVERRDQATAFQIGIVTLQPAAVPTKPAAPNLPLSLALGAALGLAVGVGIALLRTLLDRRVRTLADVESAIDAPVLGGIAFDPDAAQPPLIVANAPRDPRAEAFRSLRTNVRFLFPTGGPGVFVVTSAGPGEGKSTTAANLAIAFSESGYRVALIDADLRKPRVAGLFGIEGAIGLSDVLIGRVGVHEVMQRWGRGTLFLLPSGTRPPNPAEMLGSPAMQTLVGDLTAAFDVVIIDAPPILPVTDAAVVAQHATGFLLVAAAEATRADHLASAAERLRAVDVPVLGTIVTMLPIRGADKTAYGTYSYGAREHA